MSQPQVDIYTKFGCGFCFRAKRLLEEKGVEYNEFDAFTTHLLWARLAHFSGLLSSDQYAREQAQIRELLEEEISAGKTHLEKFVAEWDRLLAITGQD